MSSPAPTASASSCFHCGLPVAPGSGWKDTVLGEFRAFCCAGCQAVARAISGSGLEEYYRLRTANALVPEPGDEFQDRLFDRAELQTSFVRRVGRLREASLALDRVRCPACLWLIEQRLRGEPGVARATVSYPGQSARVLWDPSRIELSGIRAAIREIGYEARPFDPSHRTGIERDAARRDAPRLVFAGVLGMMVMSLALAAYVLGSPETGPDLPLWQTFGRWCAMVASAVLLAYPGQEFFAGAWRDLRRRRAGMDTPIALGLFAAWASSAWATVAGAGPVYFDAIGMLVFSVLLARAFETRARLAAARVLDRFALVEPATARRIGADRGESEVAALDLAPGDRILVRPGEIVPADGVLLEGRSRFDESVLTGEPWPQSRRPGDAVAAGSSNLDQPALLRVTRVGEASTLGEIRRLLGKGLASRPPSGELADRLAGRLVVAVLALSAATAIFWAVRDPAVALRATVAVLIVTCPCALALATPIALTVSAGRLARIGVLPARMAAMESLSRADTVAFDKTGTLTRPALVLEHVSVAGGLDRAGAVALAATLEASSAHPVARALCAAAVGSPAPPVPMEVPADHADQGVSGTVLGERWWIGTPGFALGAAESPPGLEAALERARADGRLVAVLSDRRGRAALFTFVEELRPGAREIVGDLRRAGIRRMVLISGDAREPVERLAESLGFDEAHAGMTASAKLDWIRSRQDAGARLLFVGDGLNDAATLAAAGASVSFGEAPQLSRLASDFVILGESLASLAPARRIARRSRRLLLQNVGWALAYNVLSVPLAAAGLVAPWAAALGMSASSLIVVGNAMRLARPAAGEGLSAGSEARA